MIVKQILMIIMIIFMEIIKLSKKKNLLNYISSILYDLKIFIFKL